MHEKNEKELFPLVISSQKKMKGEIKVVLEVEIKVVLEVVLEVEMPLSVQICDLSCF